MRAPRKTRAHLLFLAECDKARSSLLLAKKAIEGRYGDDGEPLDPEALKRKAGIAAGCVAKAEAALVQARVHVLKEVEHREHEADPDTIRQHQIDAELKALRSSRRRRNPDEVREAVLELRDRGMVVSAIADALRISDFTVRKVLRNAAAA